MRTFHASVWPAILLTAMSAVFLTVTDLHAQLAALEAARATPVDIVKAYLRATEARDSRTAYVYISSIG
jgi:Asp-tRNA(Asn)/Glu-tRNA(Gln) amidotransferase A subunit family amidase